jgi:hypothetical protein
MRDEHRAPNRFGQVWPKECSRISSFGLYMVAHPAIPGTGKITTWR